VLRRGKWFTTASDFPKTNWNFKMVVDALFAVWNHEAPFFKHILSSLVLE
jgi:hypothetical protein